MKAMISIAVMALNLGALVMLAVSGTRVKRLQRILTRRLIYVERMIDCCDPNGDLNKQ
jgi:hypothetical protein